MSERHALVILKLSLCTGCHRSWMRAQSLAWAPPALSRSENDRANDSCRDETGHRGTCERAITGLSVLAQRAAHPHCRGGASPADETKPAVHRRVSRRSLEIAPGLAFVPQANRLRASHARNPHRKRGSTAMEPSELDPATSWLRPSTSSSSLSDPCPALRSAKGVHGTRPAAFWGWRAGVFGDGGASSWVRIQTAAEVQTLS
jgi:hypothetical protein